MFEHPQNFPRHNILQLHNVQRHKVPCTKCPKLQSYNNKMSQATSILATKRPKYKMSQATKRPKLQKVPTTKDTNGQMSYHEDAQLKSILNTSKDNMFNLLICKYFRWVRNFFKIYHSAPTAIEMHPSLLWKISQVKCWGWSVTSHFPWVCVLRQITTFLLLHRTPYLFSL
jgi:hypothetical protein